MRIRRESDGTVVIEGLSPFQLVTLGDGVDEMLRADNPVRPFRREFEASLRSLACSLAEGARLFSEAEVYPAARPPLRLLTGGKV